MDACALKILDVIGEESRSSLDMSIGYTGLGSTNTATNNILLFIRAATTACFACGSRKAAVSRSPISATAFARRCLAGQSSNLGWAVIWKEHGFSAADAGRVS